MEGSDDVSAATASQTDGGGAEVGGAETTGKTEDAANPGESCGAVKERAEPPAPSVVTPAADSPGGVALKVATTVLHPVCLGDSPLMLPIHLQMAGGAGSQLGQMAAAATPYLIASQNPVSLPLVLDQQVLHHMGPSMIPQTNLCPNPLAFGLPPAADQKAAGPTPDANLLSLLQNPAFAAILQDLFPSQAGSASPGSAFFPLPPVAPPYASPLAPLVPPATLLVPYPVIIPLPVPLPIPLPIPVPVPQTEDAKGPKPVCTVSKSTQTSADDATSTPPFQPQNAAAAAAVSPDEVLDLSVRACPVELKQEYPSPQQDSVLDLSVPAAARKKCDRVVAAFPPGGNGGGTALSLECTQSLDSKLLGSLASLEFSRQHKWVVESSSGGGVGGAGSSSLSQHGGGGGGAGNLEIVSTSQTAKVIVSVKDAIPAILCGKIKGLSGVSTKNFSIKRDGSQSAAAASLQQLYGVPSASHGEPHDPNNPHKKSTKSRAIKLKKVSSQEIHFLPVKKQRLAALLPRK